MVLQIEFLIFLSLLTTFSIFSKKILEASVSIERLLESTLDLTASINRKTLIKDKELCILHNFIEECSYLGKPYTIALEEVFRQFVQEEKYQLSKKRFFSVIQSRIYGLWILSFTLRIVLLRGSSSQIFLDSFSIHFASFILVFSYFYALIKLYPKSWFFQQGFTSKAKVWLEALFLKNLEGPSPILSLWKQTEEEEMLYGRSMLHAKEALIRRWAFQEEIAFKKILSNYQDWIPAAEFLGLGLMVCLLLLEAIFPKF